MFPEYQSMYFNEVNRLEAMGWKNWKQNENKMFAPLERYSGEISFPSEAWDPNQVNSEAEGVWARLRASKIIRVIQERDLDLLWEVGAGNGMVAIPLAQQHIPVIAIEPLETGAQSLATAGFASYLGTLRELNLPNSSIKAIGLFDVLEHIEKPEEILEEIKRVLLPSGVLIITVPAHNFLFSDFDLSIGHFRRYSRATLTKTLEESGLTLDSINYFFQTLVIPAFILRRIPYLLGRRNSFSKIKNTIDRQSRVMQIMNQIVKLAFKIENYFNLPFGLSIIAVVRKSEN
jgi:ubiquinone/menaquinone biosynthesis C-methylase UbiE